jgi:hypothetical protein
MAMQLSNDARILLFLEHLSEHEFTGLPLNVGLKTAIITRNRGLVEWKDVGQGKWAFRLTPDGRQARDNMRLDTGLRRR